jgi:hypothetical protein
MWVGNYYNGLFGVNTAVDEFADQNNHEVLLTDEFSSTWYFFK